MTAKNMQAMRDRRTALGLKRLELYAKPAHHAKIKAYAKQIAAPKK